MNKKNHTPLPEPEQTINTTVLIIGGGITGAGIIRDLALRNISALLVDQQDLCAGASGGNHGLLHSGGRYVATDMDSAIECCEENRILKKIAPHCVEDCGGLFVAVEGDDLNFVERFPKLCQQAGIGCEPLTPEQAREEEPILSDKITHAFRVPDATVDPFHLALENVTHARMLGKGDYLPHTRLVQFEKSGKKICAALCQDHKTGKTIRIVADQYVNAGGAWAMDIARLAGCQDVHLLYSKGTLLVSHDRMAGQVINRLRPPGDGDILVPGGTVSILGTTSVRTDYLDDIKPTMAEIDRNVLEARQMIPSLSDTRYIRAFSRIRPLLMAKESESDRNSTRNFALFDHSDQGVENFCTITGGKLTTYRLMAEKTADLIATRLNNPEKCTTHTTPLPDSRTAGWTHPGLSPKRWYGESDPDDLILCECEMVPTSAIDDITLHSPGAEDEMTLEAIALRSRAGKGPCQGSFCGIRIGSHLYDNGFYTDQKGLHHMKSFFNERFRGMRPIIWGNQAAQLELAETLHRGLLGLDLLDNEKS